MMRCSGCEKFFPKLSLDQAVCPECGGTLSEDRNAYLPSRILGGKITSEGFEIMLRDAKEFVRWDDFRLACFGIVEESGLQVHNSYLRAKKAIKKIFAKDKKDEFSPRRQSIYLEMFVADREQPYRIDSSNINYRDFLGEVGHVSENNFRKLLVKLSDYLSKCEFDKSFSSFVSNKKADIRRFGSVYDFQKWCKEKWQQLKGE